MFEGWFIKIYKFSKNTLNLVPNCVSISSGNAFHIQSFVIAYA